MGNEEKYQRILQRAAARMRPTKFSAERKAAAQKIIDAIVAMDGHAGWKIFAEDEEAEGPALGLQIGEYDAVHLLWTREKGWKVLAGEKHDPIDLLFNSVTSEFEVDESVPEDERTDVMEMLLARTVKAFESRYAKVR